MQRGEEKIRLVIDTAALLKTDIDTAFFGLSNNMNDKSIIDILTEVENIFTIFIDRYSEINAKTKRDNIALWEIAYMLFYEFVSDQLKAIKDTHISYDYSKKTFQIFFETISDKDKEIITEDKIFDAFFKYVGDYSNDSIDAAKIDVQAFQIKYAEFRNIFDELLHKLYSLLPYDYRTRKAIEN